MATVQGTVHPDRPVRLVERDGRKVVVKQYLAGGAEPVYSAMEMLWRSSFGIGRVPPGLPEPISLNPGGDEISMGFVAGEPLGSRGDLGGTLNAASSVASLLAALHDSGVVVARSRNPRALLRSCARKAAELRDRGSPVADAAGRVVEKLAHHLCAAGPMVLSHGDFSPRNVLVADAGLVLIDFDRLQMAMRERDIAYWGAWIWTTMFLAGRTPSWQGGHDLADHYRVVVGQRLDDASLQFHQAVALLRIAHGWSALRSLPDLAAEILAEAARSIRPGTA